MSRPAERVVADDVELETPTPEPSLRETIEAARDEVVDRHQTEPPEGGDEAAPARGDGKIRDHSGRFARRAPVEEVAAAVEGRQPPAADQSGAAAGSPAQAQPSPAPAAAPAAAPDLPPSLNVDIAPQGWTPKGKAIWAALPLEARQEIVRREYDAHRLATRFDGERAFGREIGQVAQRFAPIFQRENVTPQQFYGNMTAAYAQLTTGSPAERAAVLGDLARRSGLDLRALVMGSTQNPTANGNAPAPSPGRTPPPPELLAALQPILQPLLQQNKEWQQFQARQRAEAEAREAAEQQQTYDEIVAFRSKPEARFFDAVKDHMIALLSSNQAASLEDAYRDACWARPDIRAVLQREESEAAAAKARKAEKVNRARQAGGSIRGGAGGAPPAGGGDNRTLRQELEANFAEARGRA